MTHILFANLVRDTSGGWWDMVSRGTLEQCLSAGNLIKADWAHVVELETGEIVRSKSRRAGGPELTDVAWSPAGGVVDVPVSSCMLISQEEASKLALLGGEHWIRAHLSRSQSPAPVPQVRSAREFLQAMQGREFPLLIVGEQAGWADQLRQEGLLDAEFTMEAVPGGDWAVVLGITAQGREVLRTGAEGNHGAAS